MPQIPTFVDVDDVPALQAGDVGVRTVILGNAGSGKSTLARAIAAAAQVPLLDLDTVFWEPDAVAVPRATESAIADVMTFCTRHAQWVVEGCYGNLVEVLLALGPRLLLLHPGRDVCLDNCRRRPWEPHKYKTRAEQDAHLDALLAWVAAYYERDGPLSWAGHRALFDGYAGPKQLITRLPRLTGRPASAGRAR